MQSQRVNNGGAAGAVIGRIHDQLKVRRHEYVPSRGMGIVSLHDSLRAIIQLAITDRNPKSAIGEELPMNRRNAVYDPGDSQRVSRPAPGLTL